PLGGSDLVAESPQFEGTSPRPENVQANSEIPRRSLTLPKPIQNLIALSCFVHASSPLLETARICTSPGQSESRKICRAGAYPRDGHRCTLPCVQELKRVS